MKNNARTKHHSNISFTTKFLTSLFCTVLIFSGTSNAEESLFGQNKLKTKASQAKELKDSNKKDLTKEKLEKKKIGNILEESEKIKKERDKKKDEIKESEPTISIDSLSPSDEAPSIDRRRKRTKRMRMDRTFD